jgi:hypothetical protein
MITARKTALRALTLVYPQRMEIQIWTCQRTLNTATHLLIAVEDQNEGEFEIFSSRLRLTLRVKQDHVSGIIERTQISRGPRIGFNSRSSYHRNQRTRDRASEQPLGEPLIISNNQPCDPSTHRFDTACFLGKRSYLLKNPPTQMGTTIPSTARVGFIWTNVSAAPNDSRTLAGSSMSCVFLVCFRLILRPHPFPTQSNFRSSESQTLQVIPDSSGSFRYLLPDSPTRASPSS